MTYIISNKENVFDCFQQFYTAVDRYMRLRLQVVCSDNEGNLDLFENYYREHGNMHKRAIPKTAQQNGFIGTICEKMLSMLSCAKLPKTLWVRQGVL